MRIAPLLALVVCAAACAQPGVEELARLQAQAVDDTRSAPERREDASRIIEIRRTLISQRVNDPRRGLWMIDQAGDLLARLGADGADTAVLFGAGVFGQRERVERDSREAMALIEAAPGSLAAGIRTLDERNDLAGASDLRAAERDVRLDFFNARASLLAAALAIGEERRRLAALAVRAGSDLELEGAAEAARLTTIGVADLYAGRVADAERALSSALTMANAGGVPRAVWCEAVLGMAECEATRGDIIGAVRRLDQSLGGAPVVVDDSADAALGMVVLGVRARLMIDARLIDDAFDAHLRAFERGFPGIDPQTSTSIVLESMANAATGLDLSTLAPEVGFARAIQLSRDEATRREAIELLSSVADRPDASSLKAQALWEMSVLLLDGDRTDQIRAVQALTRLANESPGAERAPQALEAALAYGQRLAPDGASAYADALDVVVKGRPDIADRSFWLIERAKLALRAGRLESALSTLELVSPSDIRSKEAETLFGAAVREALDALWLKLVEARAEGRSVATMADREIVPLAGRAVIYARDRDLAWLSQMRADLADGRTEAGEAGARVLYQRLIDDGETVPGGDVRLRLGLARSLLLAEERERAFARLLEASDLFGDRVPDDPRGAERFWLTWTLILELQAEENDAGARSGVILAHIVRLETIDPSLGGDPWRARIEAVRASAS